MVEKKMNKATIYVYNLLIEYSPLNIPEIWSQYENTKTFASNCINNYNCEIKKKRDNFCNNSTLNNTLPVIMHWTNLNFYTEYNERETIKN